MLATELSPETKIIISLLTELPIGEVVTLATISRAIGRDIATCRGYLYSAIKRMEADHGAVFASVRKIGYKRLPAEEIPQIGKAARDRIRRMAMRGSKTIAAGMAGANALPDNVRRDLYGQQAALTMIAHLARDKFQPKVEDASRPPTTAETAKGFLLAIGAVRTDAG